MTVTPTLDAGAWLSKYLDADDADTDLPRAMLAAFAEALMSAQASMQCNAAYGERTEERENSRNGYRIRPWDTRVGTIDLAVPKLRSGVYSPEFLLRPRRRAEQALMAVVCQAYVEGVSTRRVDDLVKAMGIDGISKSEVSRMAAELDAKGHRVQRAPARSGPLSLPVDRRADPAGARGRPGGQHLDGHRHGHQRRGAPRDRRLRRRHHRRHRGLDGLLALLGGPGALRSRAGHLRRPRGHQGRHRDRLRPRRRGSAAAPTSWRTSPLGSPRPRGR